MSTIRIIAVEDDPEYVQVLEQVLARNPNLELVRAFGNSVEFLAEMQQLQCDVIFLDIRMPKVSGLDCIGQIREFLPDTKIIMLTFHDDDDYVIKAFFEGADGYLLKDSHPRKILSAIDDAMEGGAPMSPAIARKLIKLLGRLNQQNGQADRIAKEARVKRLLSDREFEILQQLASGKQYAEIAELLFIAVDTVKTHIRHIYEKLEVRNKTEAITAFLE